MHPQLETYRSGFLDIKNEASALVEGVDEKTLSTRPDPETWSIAQVFDHLNTAGWLLLNPLEEAVQEGRAEGPYADPPFEYGVVSRWFVRSMQPSSSWTFRTPSVFEPDAPAAIYPQETIEDFRSLQNQFAHCVEAANGIDLRRVRVSSPALPLLRISLGAWFEATLAHEWRHLAQIRDILEMLRNSNGP